jgi:hypothetical protein
MHFICTTQHILLEHQQHEANSFNTDIYLCNWRDVYALQSAYSIIKHDIFRVSSLLVIIASQNFHYIYYKILPA